MSFSDIHQERTQDLSSSGKTLALSPIEVTQTVYVFASSTEVDRDDRKQLCYRATFRAREMCVRFGSSSFSFAETRPTGSPHDHCKVSVDGIVIVELFSARSYRNTISWTTDLVESKGSGWLTFTAA
jgi:hypothetical protein